MTLTYTINYDSRDNIIEVNVRGDLTLQRVKEITSEVLKVSKEQNCFFILTDLREATAKLSTLEIYELPKTLSEIAVLAGLGIVKFRRAFVAPKGQKKLTFFDNVSFNRSQNAKFFLTWTKHGVGYLKNDATQHNSARRDLRRAATVLEVKAVVVFIRPESADQFGKFGVSAGIVALSYRKRRNFPVVILERAFPEGQTPASRYTLLSRYMTKFIRYITNIIL